MSDGYPSMTALLGLLALAGYQNRDKIAEMLRGGGHAEAGQGGPTPQGSSNPGSLTQGSFSPGSAGPGEPAGGLLADIGRAVGGGGAGSFLGGGIGQLVDHFRQNGHGEAAQSWVGQGPNRDMAPHEVGEALGPDLLDALVQRTGLSPDELKARLSRTLPGAVDRYTPDGALPAR